MSGTNDIVLCPRCGRNHLDLYIDWKPWDTTTGICMDCGFTITSGIEINLNEAKELAFDCDYKVRKFTKKERKQIADFDKMHGLKKR